MRSAGGSGASGVGLWLRRLLGVRAGRARLPGMNPFLTESPLPYQLPDFTAIAVEHFAPALEEGMAQQRDEVAAITAATEPATFADTVDALERSGAVLRRVTAVLSHLTSADTNDALREIEATWKPRLTAHRTAILTDEALFARIDQLQRTADELGLTAEQRHLVQRLHTDFRRAGAGLARDVAARVAEIDTELSELTTRFGNALLDESNARALHLTEEAELDGLDDAQRAAARAAAADRGLDGWLLTLVLPTPQPALASLRNREVRRRLHEAAVGRGIPAGGDLAVRIARLRAERARLTGYEHHAAYVAADVTAGSTDTIDALLDRVIGPAVRMVEADAVELTALLRDDLGDPEATLEPWDWAYYAERLRTQRHELDLDALRAYFPLEQVLQEGVFAAATELYGISFTRRDDLVGPHPEAMVFEVHDVDGSGLGLFVGDYFARPSKRGGAWMNNLVDQSHLLGRRPVVCNTMNVPPPAPGEPALLTLGEVKTMFHEFGHALHGLFADSSHPRTSGTSVARDFVEFPSQVNEMWLDDPTVMARFARHHRTGEPLPAEVVARIRDAATFNQGWLTTEHVAAVCLDQAWHRLTVAEAAAIDDPVAFEAEALAARGLDVRLVPPRYRTGYFNHVFAGGYSAGYYSYLWSEVLDADTVEWFGEQDRPLRESGDHFRRTLLSRGSSRPEMESYREFRGRDPRPEAMLRSRGLLATH